MIKSLRAYKLLLAIGFRAAPRQATLQLLSGMFFQLQGAILAFGAKLLVDAAVAQTLQTGLLAGLLMALAISLGLVAVFYYVDWLFTVMDRAGALATHRLMTLMGSAHGLAHYEQPDYQDQVQRIREEQNRLGGMVNATAGLLRAAVALIITGFLLVRVHPLLILLPLFGILSVWLGKRSQELEAAAQEATSEPARLYRHLFEVGTAAPQGKELRMFGLTDHLRQRHHQVSDNVLHQRNRATWQGAWLRALGGLISGLAFIGAIALVLFLALRGQATPGDVILTIGLAAQMNNIIFLTVSYGTGLLWLLKVAERFLWLEEYAASTTRSVSKPLELPARLSEGIELRDVSFGYPGSKKPTLDNVSLHLPAGKVIALVGENGAGKTTLVKLLTDFYQPSDGQILIDGRSLAQISPETWRSRLSTTFQDFSKFEFLVRETVAIADLPRIEDREAVVSALGQAGADGLVAALPNTLDTQLGSAWADGVDLSGGQWQRLALARGLMRSTPLLVVFDEPTAALDAPTEYALFQRFASAARASRHQGTITLLVSHRFSTVRMADLILVLDDGRIREYGSHEALMAEGGLYAELYGLQSQAYM